MIEGFAEPDVTATVYYEKKNGERGTQSIQVENLRGLNNTRTRFDEIHGYDPAEPMRKLTIEENDRFVKVLKSKKSRSYTLGEVEKIVFPRQKVVHTAYLIAGGQFASPPDATEDELREIARRMNNPQVYDCNSIEKADGTNIHF